MSSARSSARAMAMRWHCPPLSLWPFSPTVVCRRPTSRQKKGMLSQAARKEGPGLAGAHLVAKGKLADKAVGVGLAGGLLDLRQRRLAALQAVGNVLLHCGREELGLLSTRHTHGERANKHPQPNPARKKGGFSKQEPTCETRAMWRRR